MTAPALSGRRQKLHGKTCGGCGHDINAYYRTCPAPKVYGDNVVLACNCNCCGRRPRGRRSS